MPVTNKDIAAAFRAAKPQLNRGIRGKRPEFICCALDNSKHQAARDAKNIIHKRLGDCFTVEVWLFDKGYRNNTNMSRKVQAWRHAWLDSLIVEFENKLD